MSGHHLNGVEVVFGMTVYWVADEHNPRKFGIAFPDGNVNYHNGSLAESIIMAYDLAQRQMDALENPPPTPERPPAGRLDLGEINPEWRHGL